jgi:hypothetical protein
MRLGLEAMREAAARLIAAALHWCKQHHGNTARRAVS